MRALSTAMPEARRLLRSDGLQRWFVHEPTGAEGQARVIKQLAPSIAVDTGLVERWLAAAARNVALKHPGCTPVEDWGVFDGHAYVVSMAPSGISLRALLEAVQASGARLAAQLVAPIGIMILEALDYAQQRDPMLTHLDLDLEGITVRTDGSLVLSEFALWSALSPAEVARCRFDSGRVQYCAPELVQSRPADCRSDIFSVGGLLYRLLTGERPFAGATQLLIALAIADGQRDRVRQRAPEASESLCDVLEVMLTTSASERFQTPAAAASALRSTVSVRDQASSVQADAGSLRTGSAELITKLFAGVRKQASLAREQTKPACAPSVAAPGAEGSKRSHPPPLIRGCVDAPRATTLEPAPPPLCFPAQTSSAAPGPRQLAPELVRCPPLPSSHERLPADPSGLRAKIAVNDGRTAYLRAAPARPAEPACAPTYQAPTQRPLLRPSTELEALLREPQRELHGSVKQDERWREPSDTVFQVRVRQAGRSVRAASVQARALFAREPERAHRTAVLPLSIAFGLVTVVALYLVYLLLS